ncbi:hypothetical protein ABT160_37160 [Streptomyces sp. NPDC001941]|uniref:hypothetical protein n=1 Tax=Streptomyces sp. NPDC001941 TaxID=3154659 RepID=UPI003330A9C4
MSFNVHARRVRDERLTVARRGSALGSAIVLYCPFGYGSTRDFLGLGGDIRRDPRAMVAALELLERSRDARTAERAAFARRRAREKRTVHRRTPTATDRAWLTAPRWAGPDQHHAHRAMVLRWSCLPVPTAEELRRDGLTDLEREVTAQVDAYLAAGRPHPEAAAVLGALLPRLRAAGLRTRGADRASRLTVRADQLRMMAELVHWDRGGTPEL